MKKFLITLAISLFAVSGLAVAKEPVKVANNLTTQQKVALCQAKYKRSRTSCEHIVLASQKRPQKKIVIRGQERKQHAKKVLSRYGF